MKSERRPDPQTKKVSKGIEKLPGFGQRYGNQILTAIIFLLVLGLIGKWWYAGRTGQADRIGMELSNAERDLSALASWPLAHPDMHPQQFHNFRTQVQKEIELNVGDVLANSKSPAQQAEGKLIQGDLYWQLASIGDLPQASTQPALRLSKTSAELMEQASRQYSDVLDSANRTTLPAAAVARAHFGLAAIAEQKSEWSAARAQYEAIAKDSAMSKAYQNLAELRLGLLSKLETPIVLGHPLQPQTAPTNEASATQLPFGPFGPLAPTTGPSSLPSGSPMTAPATEPAMPSSTPPSSAPTTTPSTDAAGSAPAP